MRAVASYLLLFFCGSLYAQNKTITGKPPVKEQTANHRVMLIPFEPKLYMSEIDHHIAAETKLSGKEIRHRFRDGLNDQLYRAFKAARYNVVDLMEDTVKYRKDLGGIYQFLAYEYVKVPDQTNYKPPVKDKQEKKIEKGQLIVETNSDRRFMNSRMMNPKVVPSLHSKYRTDVFVFINQLDIKAASSADPVQIGAPADKRRITVHYTVYSNEGKELNSGIAEREFDVDLNNPKKIIDNQFSVIATTIVSRVTRSLAPRVTK